MRWEPEVEDGWAEVVLDNLALTLALIRDVLGRQETCDTYLQLVC